MYFFMYLFAISISSLMECLYIFWSFSYQIILFFFLLLLLELFIHSIYYSFVVYLVCRYFLLLCNLSLMPFLVFSAFRKVFNKANRYLIYFFLMDCAFVVKSRNSLKTLNSKDILLCVFFSLKVLNFIFKFMIHLR